MKTKNMILAAVVAVLLCSAQVAKADAICGTLGFSSGCNQVITINANGTATISAGSSSTPYDNVEDQLVGVVNNYNGFLNSITLTSSSDIFGFDGDGGWSGGNACTLGSPSTYGCRTGGDSTGYGGPGQSFTIVNFFNGTIHFGGAGLASGGHTSFTLEGAPSQTSFTATQIQVPEPSSLALLGTGLLGLAGGIRRKLVK